MERGLPARRKRKESRRLKEGRFIVRRVRRWCEDLGISSSLELRRWLPFFLCMRIEVQDVMMILIDGGCAMTARFSTILARAGTSQGEFGASFHVVRNVRYPFLCS